MVIQVLFLIEETIITINFEDNRIDFQLCTSVQIPKEEKQKGGWDGSGRSSSSSGREWRSRPGARAGRWGSSFSIIVPLMFFYCSESCCLPAWHMSVCQDEVCAAIEMEPCSGPFIYMGILAICKKKNFQLWQRLNLPSLIGSASCLMFPRLGGWNVEMRGSIKETFSWPNISRWCDSAQQQKSVCGGWWWSKMVLTSTNSLEASDFLGQLPSGTFLLPGANLRNTPIYVFIERTTCSTPGHLLWRG